MSKGKENMRLPKRYFKNKEQEFLDFVSGDEDMLDLKEDAPILHSIGKKSGLKIPGNYWDTFPLRLSRKIEGSESPKINLRTLVYYAAAACLIAVFGYFGVSQFSSENDDDSFELAIESEEDIEDVYSFLVEELSTLTDEELLYEEAYADFLLSEENTTEENLDLILDELSEDFDLEDFEDLF